MATSDAAGETTRPPSDPTFDQAPVGMLHLDKQGIVLRVNPELCEMLGHPVREMVAKSLRAIVHPDDAKSCLDGVGRIAAGRSVAFVLEQRLRRFDGAWIWTQMHLALLPGRRGASDAILVIVTDISRQKRAEETIRQVNERLELVISNAPIVLWAIDRQGIITMSRGAGLTPLGQNTGDSVGRSLFDMYGEYSGVAENVRRALRGETLTFTAQIRGLTYETFVMPLRDAGDELAGAIGVSNDVTARQNFADALARRAEFERMLSGISSRFINHEVHEIDAAINEALKEVGEFCGIERIHVFQIRDEGKMADGTHEWFAPPRQSILQRYREWAIEAEVPWFTDALSRLEAIHIPRVADLPRKAAAERKRLEGRGVKSLLVVPMASRGKLVGFVGFEHDSAERSWSDDSIVLLTIFGEILANALENKRNRLALLRASEELESRVAARTDELSQANTKLRQQIAERRKVEADLRGQQELMEQLLAAHERDRQLTAYEIHDAIVQDIAGGLMQVEAAHELCPQVSPEQQETMDRGLKLLRGTIAEARRLISGLRPPIIDEFGIVAAIEYLVSEQPDNGPRLEFNHDVRFNRLPDLLEGTVFRIVQEALNNVQRHSRARHASVRLWHTDNELYLEIRDDGVGFEIDKVTEHHFGLRGMRERARLLKGRADIRSKPSDGTTIHVELPIAAIMTINEDRQHWRTAQRKPTGE